MKKRTRLFEILIASLKLGLTSFGGPVAHLAYFKDEYVDKRKWLSDKMYADIIAICQFLPGPASSQVGIAIGMLRGGLFGGIVSWLGFTLPSVLVLILFALFYQTVSIGDAAWISSLKIIAVAVVAHALIGMGKKLAPDLPRIAIAVGAALIMLLYSSAMMQIIVIVAAAVIGYFIFSKGSAERLETFEVTVTKRQGIASVIILIAMLIALPVLSYVFSNPHLSLFDTFFRVGTIVFGGGHVVLPLLEQEVVPGGFVSSGEFLAGYGVAQAVPGPLFTFASYLGAMMNGVVGGILATVAIFLPSFFLVLAALPFLGELQQKPRFNGVLTAVNASVVGILLAALYDPVFTSSIHSGADMGMALLLFAMLHFWKKPAWIVVITGIILGEVIAFIV